MNDCLLLVLQPPQPSPTRDADPGEVIDAEMEREELEFGEVVNTVLPYGRFKYVLIFSKKY